MGDAEWLGVAAGLLPEVKARELMKHAAQCGHCGPLLKKVAEALVDETTPSEDALLASLQSARPEWRKNMAAALRDSARSRQAKASWLISVFTWRAPAYALAGIVVVAVFAWIGVRALHPPTAEQLLVQAYTERRTIEVRIPGAKYAPLRVERGMRGSGFDKPQSLLRAEVLISEQLLRKPNDPEWLEAKARAEMLDGSYDDAINTLQRALKSQPDSPDLLTDLGSAYYLRAKSADRPIDYGNAIEAFGKVLIKSPDNSIALFNRALACEQAFLYAQALEDWQHYLRIDPQGEWAEEARSRFTALQQKVKKYDQSHTEPLLSPLEFSKSGADDVVLHKIDTQIEQYFSLAVVEWLPKAFPLPQEGVSNAANEDALRVLAKISAQDHDDFWLADLLQHSASPMFPSAVAELALAAKAIDSGDNVFAREHARQAERLFAFAGNTAGVLRARIDYMFASHDAQEADTCIEASADQERRLAVTSYRWLTIQFHLEEGTCSWLAGDLGKAQQLYESAASAAESSGYREIYLRTQDHLSSLTSATGNLAEGWSRTWTALNRFWAGTYTPMRGYNLYYNLYEFARITRQPHLGMAAWRDGVALSDSFSNNNLRAMAHSLMASAAVAAGRSSVAEDEFMRASEFFARAPQIKSTRVDRLEAETRLAEVEVFEGKSQLAVSRLRQLEPEVSKLSDDFLEVFFYTTLGNAESGVGDGKEAESALHSALIMSESLLQSLRDDKLRAEWSRRTSSTYRNFVQLRLQQGDVESALETWEWYRGAALRARGRGKLVLPTNFQLPEPHEVAYQLPQLLKETFVSYALLPRGLAIWVYDNRGVFSYWIQDNSADIEAKANHFRFLCSDPKSDASDLRESAHLLYDLLVAPIEKRLSSDRALIVELDDGFSGLPFDALLDTQGHYFGERGPMVSSLGIYYRSGVLRSTQITQDTVALVAAVAASRAPTDSAVMPLPDAAYEGEMVAHDFKNVHLLMEREATIDAVLRHLPDASIFHFAGHAIRSSQQSGLLLSDSLLSTRLIEKTSISRLQLAVLSACDTQDGSAGDVTDDDSLVRTFLSAGVPHIVASRWNVDSFVTRQFMQLFYRALLNGNTVADSIYQAQSGLRSRPGMSHPYYWSAFTAFGAV
jgi:CHAT domain-containing protein/cytochrome c-type biogenesis protein CcmH/NrfG